MQTKRTPLEALEAVITIAFGGVAARMAERFGVSDQTVTWWRKGERDGRSVHFPTDYCPICERLTTGAVRCEELRPDIEWDVLRMQAESPIKDEEPPQARQMAVAKQFQQHPRLKPDDTSSLDNSSK